MAKEYPPQEESLDDLTKAASEQIRTPVIDSESLSREQIERYSYQWALITQAILEEIHTDSHLREQIIRFIQFPLGEALPHILLEEVQTNVRIHKLCMRYHEGVMRILRIATVPDEAIGKYVAAAGEIPDIQKEVSEPRYHNPASSSRWKRFLRRQIDEGEFRKGVSQDEKSLLLFRYRLARDVKMLALSAYWTDHPLTRSLEHDESPIQKIGDGETGLEIAVCDGEQEKLKELVQPRHWQKRVQIKDRVFAIEVNGKKYIMKERKTGRHKDTFKSDTHETLHSIDEITLAQIFNTKGSCDTPVASLDWEKPIGAVIFPDGFEFAIFYLEDGDSPKEENGEVLRILEGNQQSFEQEYRDLVKRVLDYLSDPRIGEVATALREALGEDLASNIRLWLSVKVFLEVKEKVLWKLSELLPTYINLLLGYQNLDLKKPEVFWHFIQQNDKLSIQFTGYDFEYYKKIEPAQEGDRSFAIEQTEARIKNLFRTFDSPVESLICFAMLSSFPFEECRKKLIS